MEIKRGANDLEDTSPAKELTEKMYADGGSEDPEIFDDSQPKDIEETDRLKNKNLTEDQKSNRVDEKNNIKKTDGDPDLNYLATEENINSSSTQIESHTSSIENNQKKLLHCDEDSKPEIKKLVKLAKHINGRIICLQKKKAVYQRSGELIDDYKQLLKKVYQTNCTDASALLEIENTLEILGKAFLKLINDHVSSNAMRDQNNEDAIEALRNEIEDYFQLEKNINNKNRFHQYAQEWFQRSEMVLCSWGFYVLPFVDLHSEQLSSKYSGPNLMLDVLTVSLLKKIIFGDDAERWKWLSFLLTCS